MDTDTQLFKNIEEDHAIRLILEGTAADIGERFFMSLVENLTKVLNTMGAWVTEYLEAERRLNSLAFIFDGRWLNGVQYDITNTACESVIVEKQLVHVKDRLLDLYQGNPDLTELEKIFEDKNAISYLGVPLTDADEKVLGHLSVIDARPIPEDPQVVDIFRIFANRASAELQRLRAEQQIVRNEQKFRKLFDSAMDAIIEIDRQFRITRINLAGEKLFKTSSASISGSNLTGFIAKKDHDKIKMLIKTLERQPQDQQNLWIPGGLQARAVDGEIFPAEGTLSMFEFGQHDYYTLILHNEKERIEAEQKIQSMSVEAEYLKEEIRAVGNYGEIIGDSEALIQVLRKVRQVSPTDASVLIYGETGTGKEAIARTVHASSRRRDRPLITVNCAAIPAALIESEFFGHEKGAFTGAAARRLGRFSLADKGTLFLDEIGELPIDMQVKLLRVLQNGEFEPVGSSESVRVDVRIISATNHDLAKAVEKGTFREDLYYRLNVFPLNLPPLRQRGDDIITLASYFILKFSRRMGHAIPALDRQQIQMLKAYDWPGNVRELQNVIEHAIIISQGGPLSLASVMPAAHQKKPSGNSDAARLTPSRLLTEADIRRLEKDNLISALETTGWRVSGSKGAARLLGMNPSTFASRMKKLGINRP